MHSNRCDCVIYHFIRDHDQELIVTSNDDGTIGLCIKIAFGGMTEDVF